MAVKTESKNVTRILFAVGGCLALCLVISIVGGVLLWTQLPKPKTQTAGPVPQPSVAITANTMEQVKELYLIPLPGYVYDVAWSPDGLILASAVVSAGSDPGSVQLWDAVTGRNLSSIDQVEIFSLVFSPDGQMLAGAGDKSLIVWNVADGRELSNTPLSSFGAGNLAFSADSRILAYEAGKNVHLLEAPGGRVYNTLQHSSRVMGFGYLPDGKSLITVTELDDMNTYESGNATFTVWGMDSGQTVRTFTQPGNIERLVVAPDGKSLAAVVGGGKLMIWDMESGDRLQSFTGFRFGVPRFAFSPDGSVLAAGEGIGFEAASPSGLRLFDLTTGREIPMLTGHEGVILNVAFSPNGRLLATASEDKTIRLWGVPPQAAP